LRRGALVGLALLVALAVGGVARAEVEQAGDVVVSFDGGISPHALPRAGVAPVTVRIESGFRSAQGADPPPQLRTISIGINRRGRIFDRGLPTCRVRKIQPTTIRAARRICGGAIVGSGHVQVRIHLPNQPPFTFTGPMLVFHAKRAGGDRRLLAQVYGVKPPSAFILTFRILREPGEFGTVIKTSLPASASEWAYVTKFDMKLRRIYTYKGQKHSYVSAGCAAPPGFPGAVFAFAQAKFGFAEGEQVKTTLVRDCTVRK
jgi:hypothetical protein